MLRKLPSAVTALCLLLALALPAHAAQDTDFALFLLDGEQVDYIQQDMSVRFYTKGSSGRYASQDAFSFSSRVNRLTADSTIYILPQAKNVWVTVDYLSDLNGNGEYELLSQDSATLSDGLLPTGELSPLSAQPSFLTQGETYALTAAALAQRGEELWTARSSAGGTQAMDCTADKLTGPETMVYMILIRWVDPADNEEKSQCYYLRIYEQLPALSAAAFQDVAPRSWYYASVDYAAANGLMSGTSAVTFSPDLILSRGMLAQILYSISESPETKEAPVYFDVSSKDWFYHAVSWASEEGIMTGIGGNLFAPNNDLTRQQLALILFQYAKLSEQDTSARANLTTYPDHADAAHWSREALEWAVASGLLASREHGMLAPNATVTRAECACVLRALLEYVMV